MSVLIVTLAITLGQANCSNRWGPISAFPTGQNRQKDFGFPASFIVPHFLRILLSNLKHTVVICGCPELSRNVLT